MAKSRAKVSAAQRDKRAIEIAKYLKKVGVLSKQSKLHGGRFISRSVLKKVNQYAYIESNRYKAAKVSREYLEKAKLQGYEIVRGRVIVPSTRAVEKRLAEGHVMGVVPVKGGTMEFVVTPYDTFSKMIKALNNGELDRFKLPEEQFVFTLYGHKSWQGLRDSKHLGEYLMAYDSSVEAIDHPEYEIDRVQNLAVYHINRTDVGGWTNKGENKGKFKTERRGQNAYAKREARLKQMGEIAYEKRRKEKAMKQAEYRAKLDPQKLAEQKEKNRVRMQAKRNAKTNT